MKYIFNYRGKTVLNATSFEPMISLPPEINQVFRENFSHECHIVSTCVKEGATILTVKDGFHEG